MNISENIDPNSRMTFNEWASLTGKSINSDASDQESVDSVLAKAGESLIRHARKIMHLVPIKGGVPEILQIMPHEDIVSFSNLLSSGNEQADDYLEATAWTSYKAARSAAVKSDRDVPAGAILNPVRLENNRWGLRMVQVEESEYRNEQPSLAHA